MPLRDVGYLQVVYDRRRASPTSTAGEVVGGIAIMEQGRNVLVVTKALLAKLDELRPSLPDGSTSSPPTTLVANLGHADQFPQAIGYELIRRHHRHRGGAQDLRAAVAPVAILLFGTLFTALPLSLFGQTINLFALAACRLRLVRWPTRRSFIVENCTSVLDRRRNATQAERMATIIHATATMTRPLLSRC